MDAIKFKAELLAFITVFSVPVLFYFYSWNDKTRLFLKSLMKRLNVSWKDEGIAFISEKLTGILYTGLIPFIVFLMVFHLSPEQTGFVAGNTFRYRYIILFLILLTAFLSFLSSKSRRIQQVSPELKLKNWYPAHLFISASAWIIYLFGYEMLFRGILWFVTFETFGFWPAMIINLFLYAAVHVQKGLLIAAGTLPVGIIFCLLSYLTGSFFAAFMIHFTLAISTEISSLYHNPDIHFHLTGRAR